MVERPLLARIVPFAAYLAFIAIADLLGRLGLEAPALRWLYPLKIAVVLALLLCYRKQYRELQWRGLRAATVGLAVLVGVVVLVLWINLNASWMILGNAAGFDPRTQGTLDWTLVLIRIAGAALVVPVMEELFWRSFLLRWITAPDFLALSPAGVTLRAMAVCSVLFGIEHTQWLAGVVAGAAYGWLYCRSRSLAAAVIAHGVTNGLLGVWIISTEHWTYW